MSIFPAIHLGIRHALPGFWRAMGLVGATSQANRYQDNVDRYFRSTVDHWRDVYATDGLSATVYQMRREIVLNMFDKLRLPPTSQVLDVGCGTGFIAVGLAQRGVCVHAVDTVHAMIEQTRHLAQIMGVSSKVRTSLGNIRKLRFVSGSFDAALAIGVIPWLDNPRQGVHELARIVKPGGHVIIAADNHWALNNVLDPLCFPGLRSWRRRVRAWLEKNRILRPRSSRPPLSYHSIRAVDTMLSEAGFIKVEGRTFGFGPFTFLKIPLLSDALGLEVHRKLQVLADRRYPVLRSSGIGYAVLARKVSTAQDEQRPSRRSLQ